MWINELQGGGLNLSAYLVLHFFYCNKEKKQQQQTPPPQDTHFTVVLKTPHFLPVVETVWMAAVAEAGFAEAAAAVLKT